MLRTRVPQIFIEIAAGGSVDDLSIWDRDDDAAQIAIDYAFAAIDAAVQDTGWMQPALGALAVTDGTPFKHGGPEDLTAWYMLVTATDAVVQDTSGWVQASQDQTSGSTYNDDIAETAASSDALTGLLNPAVGVVAETAASSDTQTGLLVAVGVIAEAAASTDSLIGGLALSSDVAETAATADTPAASLTIAGAVAETAAATDAQTGLLAAVGAVAETAAATDAQTGLLAAVGVVAETAAITDAQTGVGGTSTYNEDISETVATTDAPAGVMVMGAAVSETVAANDNASAPTAAENAPSSPYGGGARRDSGGRRGSAKIKPISDEVFREAYEKAMGIKPTASVPTQVRKAIKAAVRRHALEDALVPGVTPPADAIDWQAIMADTAAVEAFRGLVARIAKDEEDAILALLLAA